MRTLLVTLGEGPIRRTEMTKERAVTIRLVSMLVVKCSPVANTWQRLPIHGRGCQYMAEVVNTWQRLSIHGRGCQYMTEGPMNEFQK